VAGADRRAGTRTHLKLSLAAFAAIALSQVFYNTLVWTQWKAHTSLWRAWWVTLVFAVGLTHVAWLWVIAEESRSRLAQFTTACIAGATLFFAALGFRYNLLDELPTALGIALAILVAGALTGSTNPVGEMASRAGEADRLAMAEARLVRVGYRGGVCLRVLRGPGDGADDRRGGSGAVAAGAHLAGGTRRAGRGRSQPVAYRLGRGRPTWRQGACDVHADRRSPR
jgi:hypothetical protein